MDERRQRADLAGGPIEFYEAGEGPPLLFAHGVLSNAHTWNAVVPLLSGQYRCIVPTLPLGGHRLPMAEAADLTPAGIADLLRQFLDTIGLDAVTVVGNDTGGACAQVFAAAFPSRVSALVLSNCDALDVFPPAPFAFLPKVIGLPFATDLTALAFRVRPLLASRLGLGLLSNRLTADEIRTHYVDGFIQNHGVRRDFRKVVKGWAAEATEAAARRLAVADIPTLLLWGTDDTELFPVALARRLHERWPHSSLVLVDGARTFVQVDRPEAFAERVAAFLAAG